RFLSAEAELPAALEIPAVALDHRVVRIGGLVIEAVFRVILDRVHGGGAKQASAHAGFAVVFGDFGVAARALARVGPAVRGGFERQRHRARQNDRLPKGHELASLHIRYRRWSRSPATFAARKTRWSSSPRSPRAAVADRT